jgi:glycosyl transferase family 25
MSIPPIHIISFAGNSVRKTYMNEQMQQLGLTATFVEAIDGRALSEDRLTVEYDATLAQRSSYGELTRGEIGCALSHKKIWQQLIKSEEKGYIVLEDDALLKPESPAIFSALQKTAKPGDFVNLGKSNANTFVWLQKTLFQPYRLVYINQALIGAIGYYITKEAAKRFLKVIPKIYFPIDFWYQTPGFKGITPIKAVVPTLVEEMSFASTIGQRGKKANGSIPITRACDKQTFLSEYFRQVRLMLKNRYLQWPVKL